MHSKLSLTSSLPLRPCSTVNNLLVCCLVAASLAAFLDPAVAQTRPAQPAQRQAEPVTLNFSNADIEAVARTMATIMGRNVVVDPRVKGTLTLTTERPVTPAAAFEQFTAQLRLQGFAVVSSEGLYKIVPESDAKLQGGRVSAGPVARGSNQIVTQIFKLSHESANNLVPVLRPLISPNNTINVNPGTNALVITDYADNLQRLARIIASLDVANASDVEIIALQHSIAADMAPLVGRLLESSGGGGGGAAGAAGAAAGPDTSFRTTLLAEPRSNSLILRAANPARVALVRALVAKLDQPAARGSSAESGNIHVVYLKNADATQLAATLRSAMAGGASAAAALAGSGGGGNQPTSNAAATGGAVATNAAGGAAPPLGVGTTGGQIQADPSTNSLIISAPEPQYRQLRAVIDRLDSRRAQVYVESLIAEVNADKAAEFGIQWQGPLGGAGNSLIGFLGTNFGAGGNNILNLSAQGLATSRNPDGVTPGPGFNFGAAQRVGGVYTLGLLARVLEQTGNGNILSTPNLLTLDNEEAKIVIGQNVPFVTGRYTNTGGGNNGAINPFQTIERKDVGLTLRVRPQISENGTVKLVVAQEVSSVQASSVNSPSGLITNKRSIDSTVLVQDGGIVVLGGLLQDEYSGNQEKVPVLGDIPLVGNLFKNEQRSRRKTNLMVFLRPVVVRDGARTDGLAMDRYDLMRGLQQGAQPRSSVIVPVNEAPVLPLMPAPLMPGAPGGAPPQQPSLAPAQPMPAPSPSSQSIGAVYDPSLYRP